MDTDLLSMWLKPAAPATRKAYSYAISDLSKYMKSGSEIAAITTLLSNSEANAVSAVALYRSDMVSRELSPAKINLNLSAIRSLFHFLKLIGASSFDLRDVRGVMQYSTRGNQQPQLSDIANLLSSIPRKSEIDYRNLALLVMIFKHHFKRAALVSLNVEHLESIELSPTASTAVRAYLRKRGSPSSGPLFINYDHAKKGTGRLTSDGVSKVINRVTRVLGVHRFTPESIRQTGLLYSISQGESIGH